MFRLYQGRLQSFVMKTGSAYRALWLLVAVLLASCGKTSDEPASPVVNAPPISAEQQRLEDFLRRPGKLIWLDTRPAPATSASKINRTSGTMCPNPSSSSHSS